MPDSTKLQGDAAAYRPVKNYGVIGDIYSVALVDVDWSSDWLCPLHFGISNVSVSRAARRK
jgi:hypothetical protein